MRHFRILSLDGGGIRGAFSASVVATLEETTGRAAVNQFDLITGTSTGGIIAIGLALGLPARRIVQFYREHGPQIFRDMGVIGRWKSRLRHLITPKRSRAQLGAALASVFAQKKLGDAQCRLVIPTYDAVAGRIYLLKTAHHPRFVFDQDASAVDCALATSAAPTYFEASPFPRHEGASYIDGGVWANCPAMVGLVEATAFLGVRATEIDILSIGTLSQPFSVSPLRRKFGGLVAWNVGLVELLMRGQIEAAMAQAKLLTGDGLHRIDTLVEPGRFSLDDAGQIDDLIALGAGEARKREHIEAVTKRFLNDTPAARFTPLRQ
jgi:patatin-like phospholipase/acyl hydrolase